jgi:hypothetical protein
MNNVVRNYSQAGADIVVADLQELLGSARGLDR